jgi:hypothetical protein
MKTLAEVFLETLSERDKPLVRMDSKGKTAVVLDPKTISGNRRVEANRHEIERGHFLRNAENTHERALYISHVKELPRHPDHGGRQVEVTAHHTNKIFASDKPIGGYSSRRPDNASNVPPKRLVKPKKIVLVQHPRNNGRWIGGGYMAVVPKDTQTPRVIKTKRPGYGGF